MSSSTETAEYKAASEFNRAFETAKRTDGEIYIKLSDTAAPWMRQAIQQAHGEMFPDDWVYSKSAEVVNAIAGALNDGVDVDDMRNELVDGLVDVYTSNLTAWLNSHAYRVGYCDEAAEEYGHPVQDERGIVGQIMLGQYWEIEQILEAIWRAIQTQAEGDNG